MASIAYSGAWRLELDTALAAGKAAESLILDFYNSASAETYTKQDGSVVTDADLAADRTIREVISLAFPDDALLTEEGARDLHRLRNPRVWIVDPIDGTAEFVKRTGLFDVMIALAVAGRPVVAVSVSPVGRRTQAAVLGAGAWEIRDDRVYPLAIDKPAQPPRLVTSKWYGGYEPERGSAVRRIATRLGAPEPPVLEVGYQARAFSPVERTYDAYIGLPSSASGSIAQEWDLACVDLITHEAGGALTDCWGRLHRYNKRSTGISGGVLASARPALQQRLVAAIAPELPSEPPAEDPADDGL
jgi:3'-phosphoadenosine 5'-phosphosulfate (PAPS) 3'-phosphatase